MKNAQLQFYTNCGDFSLPITLSSLWVRPLNYTHIHLILRLNFLITPDRVVLLTKDYAIFLSTPDPILSEYPFDFRTLKHGDILDSPNSNSPSICSCAKLGECKGKGECKILREN